MSGGGGGGPLAGRSWQPRGFHPILPRGPSQLAVGIWRWFGKLVSLEICTCNALIYWPEDVFLNLIYLKHLDVNHCKNLVGLAQVKGEASPPTRTHVLSRLNWLRVFSCARLARLFVLSHLSLKCVFGIVKSLEFIWEVEAESKSVHVEQLDTSMSPEYRASTSVPKQSAAPTTQPLPRLEFLYITGCDGLATLPDLLPALRVLQIGRCQKLCSVSGQLDALERLSIYNCNVLQSLVSPGHLPSLIILDLWRCKQLTSIPGALGAYYWILPGHRHEASL